MRHFIFVTNEGITHMPDSPDPDNDPDNAQVMGIESGIDEDDAFKKLLKKEDWLLNSTYNEIVIFELKDRHIEGWRYIQDIKAQRKRKSKKI